MSSVSEKSTTHDESRKREELDSYLDGALDELDVGDTNSEDEQDCWKPKNETARGAVESNNVQQNNQHSDGNDQVFGDLPSTDFEREDMESQLEAMMLDLARGCNIDGSDDAVNKLMQEMEKNFEQFSSEKGSFSAKLNHDRERKKGPNVSPNIDDSVRKKEKESNSSLPLETEDNMTEIDRTVAKILSDMAKSGAPEIGTEPENMESMGEEIMEEMMKEFGKIGAKDDSGDVIDGMLKQLLSKDLMYEPMKQVTEEFPRWLAENKQTLSNEDYCRYGNQYQYFQRIIALYDREPDNFVRLMELMQNIQEFGQPPADIMKKLSPELDFNEDGMPKIGDFGSLNLNSFGDKEQCVLM